MKKRVVKVVFVSTLTFFASSILLGAYGQGSSQWIRQFGTSSSDYANSITVDGQGNSWVAGHTYGALPGQASTGKQDAFVRKYDANGNELWTRQFGTSEIDYANSIAVDGTGNISVAGYTEGSFPGQASSGENDAFVGHYDANGNELWTRQFGTSGNDFAFSTAVDERGNIYVAGSIDGTLPGQASTGKQDAFVRKYDPNGNELWTRQFGTGSLDRAHSITVDGRGNIWVAGYTEGTLGQASAGDRDAFVRKYDPNGNELWTRQFGTSNSDEANSIAVDDMGSVWVAGDTDGTFPGQSSVGQYDAFVRKYDANGNELWTRQFGTSDLEQVNSIAHESGSIWVAGFTMGSLPSQSWSGSADAFVRLYEPNGNELWTYQFGSRDDDRALSIAVDGRGNVWVAGFTNEVLPGQSSAGSYDAFVFKYGR